MGLVPGPRGGTTPRTIPRTFRGYLLGRYTRAPAFRVARTVCIGVLVRLLRVSLLHMSPFTNIIHSHSNVLLHMSQSRTLLARTVCTGVLVRLLRVSCPPALCSVCPLESVRRGLGSLMYRGRVVSNIGTLSQTTSLPLVILPDMTTDVMCMCHVGWRRGNR